MNVSTLREIANELRGAVERDIMNKRAMNALLLDAWEQGVLDAVWAEIRRDTPKMHLHYYIRARGTGDIKIGKTNSPQTRFANLFSANSRGVDLIACYPEFAMHESELKAEFSKSRLCCEWFLPSEELLDWLQLIGVDTRAFTNDIAQSFMRRGPTIMGRPVGDKTRRVEVTQ